MIRSFDVNGGRIVAASSSVGPWLFRVRDGDAYRYDYDAIRETWDEDVYGLDRIKWDPVTVTRSVPVVEPRSDGMEQPPWHDLRTKERLPIVIDVGAHIGSVTVRCALAGAIVHAYEPFGPGADLLRANIDTLGSEGRVFVYDRAVAATTGRVVIGEIAETGMGTITVDAGGSLAPRVPAVTLADAVTVALSDEHDTSVRFVKIDVEGAEYDILRAAPHETLATVENLSVETHATDATTFGTTLAHLGHTHNITFFGPHDSGGYLYATRY